MFRILGMASQPQICHSFLTASIGARNGKTHEVEGNGLGLAIVKSVWWKNMRGRSTFKANRKKVHNSAYLFPSKFN